LNFKKIVKSAATEIQLCSQTSLKTDLKSVGQKSK